MHSDQLFYAGGPGCKMLGCEYFQYHLKKLCLEAFICLMFAQCTSVQAIRYFKDNFYTKYKFSIKCKYIRL